MGTSLSHKKCMKFGFPTGKTEKVRLCMLYKVCTFCHRNYRYSQRIIGINYTDKSLWVHIPRLGLLTRNWPANQCLSLNRSRTLTLHRGSNDAIFSLNINVNGSYLNKNEKTHFAIQGKIWVRSNLFHAVYRQTYFMHCISAYDFSLADCSMVYHPLW